MLIAEMIRIFEQISQKLNEINGFLKDLHGQVLSQMAPDQRQTMLTNLDILKASMEAVKELMV